MPPSELGPAAWVMQFVTYTSGNYMASVDSGLWRGTYGNAMFMGAVTSSNGTCFTQPYGPVLYASEAYEVDKKIDDGKPALGKVRAWNTHVTVPDISDDCTMNDTSPTNANYKVSAYRKECALVFITGL